jgi:hypothetical protein
MRMSGESGWLVHERKCKHKNRCNQVTYEYSNRYFYFVLIIELFLFYLFDLFYLDVNYEI